MADFLTTFGEDLKENISGFIAVSVIEVKSGISYFSLSASPVFDLNIAAVYNLEIYKSKVKTIKAIGLDEKLQDIIFTLQTQIHIIDVSEDGSYLIYLVVDSAKSNLGLTRAVLSKYKKGVAENLNK